MLRLLADQNFNEDIISSLLDRRPGLDAFFLQLDRNPPGGQAGLKRGLVREEVLSLAGDVVSKLRHCHIQPRDEVFPVCDLNGSRLALEKECHRQAKKSPKSMPAPKPTGRISAKDRRCMAANSYDQRRAKGRPCIATSMTAVPA